MLKPKPYRFKLVIYAQFLFLEKRERKVMSDSESYYHNYALEFISLRKEKGTPEEKF